jgi:hypothetical protein
MVRATLTAAASGGQLMTPGRMTSATVAASKSMAGPRRI